VPRSPRRRLAFAALVVPLALAALELGARVVLRDAALASIPAESVREQLTTSDIVYDPVLGWRRSQLPNPGLGIDSNGFRHREVAVAKTTRWRGFALGDSQTYGAGVAAGQDWPSVAESRLRAAGVSVELVNAALSGYSSRQDHRLFLTKLLAFHPDFVVVDARTLDDLRDVGPSAEGGVAPAVERLLFYSRLYRGLRLVLQPVEPTGLRMRSPEEQQRRVSDPSRYGNHDLIQALGDREGVRVYFVDYPFKASPAVSLVDRSVLPPGARVIEATQALSTSGLDAAGCFLDNNHLTVAGNAVVGQAVADALLPELGGYP